MAILEQCRKCRRDLGSCPYYVYEEVKPCKDYMYPIDNSTFFSNFLSQKGRIGKIQYLVIIIISICIFYPNCFLAMEIADFLFKIGFNLLNSFGVNFLICSIIFIIVWVAPSIIIASFARKRRCNDLGTSYWSTTFIGLLFRKGEEGVNDNGTEPLKPYSPQVKWREDE